MAGGFLQLVTANCNENIYLNVDPQITLFKKVYRRATNFSFDSIELRFSSKIDFGSKSKCKILPHGDLAHRMYYCALLPDIDAYFPNLKTSDIINVLRGTIFENQILVSDKVNTINLEEVLDLIDNTIDCLNYEYDLRQDLLNNQFENFLLNYDVNNEHCLLVKQLSDGLCKNDGFIYLKLDIVHMYIIHKINYKIITLYNEHNILQRNELTPYNKLIYELDIPFLILYADIFYNIFNEPNILYDFLMKHITLTNNKVTTPSKSLNDIIINSLNATLNKIDVKNEDIINFNSQFIPGLAPTIDHYKVNVLTSELAVFTKSIIQSPEINFASAKLDFVVSNFDPYGPAYYNMINTYNIYINLMKMFGTSSPFVIIKGLKQTTNITGSLYNDNTVYLSNVSFDLFNKTFNISSDVNYSNFFIDNLIGKRKNDFDASTYCIFQPNDFEYLNDKLFDNYITHPLALLINNSFSELNRNIENKINNIFFGQFNTFMNSFINMLPNTAFSTMYGIVQLGPEYSYPCDNVLPIHCTINCNVGSYFCNGVILPASYNNDIDNIFNLNAYLLRFCSILQVVFIFNITNYVINTYGTTLATEITDKLNDFFNNAILNIKNCQQKAFSNMPSLFNSTQNMKTYIPPYYQTSNTTPDNLIISTLIFYRNLLPSMLEMLYFPINVIDEHIQTLTLENDDLNMINDLNGFFYELIKLFMDNMDAAKINAPSNFNHPYILNDDVRNVFESCFSSNPDLDPIKINRFIFYFISEMIFIREHSKFLNNIFSNKTFIQNEIGDTSFKINELILGFFIKLNNNKTFQNLPLSDNLRVKKYYDYMFIEGKTSKLFKSHYNVYKNIINSPFLDSDTFNNNYGDNPTRIYLDALNANLVDIKIEDIYELYEIDYYYIEHNTFHNPTTIIDSNIIDDFYIAVNELYPIVNRLKESYPIDLFGQLPTASIITKYLLSIPFPNDRLCGFNNPIFRYDYYFRDNFANWKSLPKINDAILCVDTPFDKIPNFLPIPQNSLFPTYDAQSELQLFLDNHKLAIDFTKQFFNYHIINLIDIVIASNQFVTSNIKVDIFDFNTNIIDAIRILKNNFRKQYLLNTQLTESNNRLFDLDFNKSILEYQNLSFAMHKVLSASQLSNVTILDNISPHIFNYYYNYPTQVQVITSNLNTLNDLSRRISGYLIPFMTPYNFAINTERDIIDIFNNSFEMMKQLILYIDNHNLIDYFKTILETFEPLIKLKYEIYDKLYQYVIKIFNASDDPILTSDNIIDLTEILLSYNLDMGAINLVLNNYEALFNLSYGNKFIKANSTDIYLKSKLDYLIIYSMMNQSVGIDITFLEYIKIQILSPMIITNHPLIEFYLKLIDQLTIEIFLQSIEIYELNHLNDDIINPMFNFGSNSYLNDVNNIENYYQSFNLKENVMEYILDRIYDSISDYCNFGNCNPDNFFNSSISDNCNKIVRYSIDLQQIHSRYKINYDDNFEYFIAKNKEFYEIVNYERKKINDQITSIENKIMNALTVKANINDIIYRNLRAHNAWIRNLGHFLIKELKLVSNGDVLDLHQLDWFQVWHELTKYVGHERGYDIMIGNTPDLNIFKLGMKKGRLLYIPLQFFFNRNTGMSLPLISLLHSAVELHIELRTIEELTYKDQFSSFTENPILSDSYVLCEYVYLEESERKAFAQKKLEYLIEQVQLDNLINPTDFDLIDIYEVACAQKPIRFIDNDGLIKTDFVYDETQAVEIEKDDFKEGMILFTRRDLKYITTHNQIGQKLLKCVEFNLDPDVPDYVMKKKLEFNLNFNHPVEFFTTLVQVQKHINPDVRILSDRNYYFYGERQYGNYSLYSYYDLSQIEFNKDQYYIELLSKVQNPFDPDFNFHKILVKIREDYITSCPPDQSFICENLLLFLNNINKLIHRILTTDILKLLVDQFNIIRLKESLTKLSIQFPFYNQEQLIDGINIMIKSLGVDLEVKISDVEKIISFNVNSFRLNLNDLELILITLLIPKNVSLENILRTIGSYYDFYNETQLNIIISLMISFIDINFNSYDLNNLMLYFEQFYISLENYNIIIADLLKIINNKISTLKQLDIDTFNSQPIVVQFIKNIIYNLVPINDPEAIPILILNAIATVINFYYNDIFENLKVDVIDYQKNIKLNDSINPLISAGLEFNGKVIIPNLDYKIWNYGRPYDYFLHTPSTGINVHSFARSPLIYQPTGSANFTKIDEKKFKAYLHPLISGKYAVTISNYCLGYNIWRVMSGLNGLAFENLKYY
jgi:hypothetical protein